MKTHSDKKIPVGALCSEWSGSGRLKRLSVFVACSSIGISPVFGAEETATQENEKKSSPAVLETVSVIGKPEDVVDMPGSAQYLDESDIRDQSYSDINRILRKVPGVYVREEDGYGLFPNISLRGVDTTRSAKVTLMEDGVLAAPAPYSAPAAYYSPNAGRMSGIEVLKGSSQIKYGPHITGGVVNYLSTPIPEEGRAYLKQIYGSYDEIRTHGFVGDTLETSAGRFGFVVEGWFRETAGFKHIDDAQDDTGFSQVEPMVKLAWEPNTEMYQRIEAKFGYSKLDADESYLGLNDKDFRKDPGRRYFATRFDNIDAEQYRTSLRYFVSPTENLDVVTTAYYSQFDRNWFKLNDLRGVEGAGNMSLSSALAGAENGLGLGCLKGEVGCTLRVRNNDRTYNLWGVDTVATYRFDLGETSHKLTGGFRYHEDQQRRYQRDELFTQAAGRLVTGYDRGTPGDAGNEREHTNAYSFHLQDRIQWGNWGFTPGIRYEHIYQEFTNYNDRSQNGSSSLDLYAGGASLDYTFNDEFMVFGGIHQGFSPPSPKDAVKNKLGEETSVSYELGARFQRGAFGAEVVGFYTQFEDLIVIDNIGGAGTGESENFGEVDSRGVELSLNFDAGQAFGWSFSNPSFITFTYTNAEQQNDAQSTDAESIFSFGKKGNKVPYIPEYALSFGTGVHFDRWGVDVVGNYVDETFTSADNTSDQVNGAGEPDARFGKTDDYIVVDVAGYYQVHKNVKLLAGIQNLFDQEYIVSRQPHGARPGMPLFAYGGIELDFDI